MKMKKYHIAVPLLAMALLVGCRTGTSGPLPATPDEGAGHEAEAVEPQPEEPIALVPVIRDAKPAAAPATPAKKAPARAKGETLYVETEGAQGRVWGHVTMLGDRGTGTIHDWDENTWAVTVTRHGNELFAVDQNSRQYVFRLK